LHRFFVFLCRRARLERSQISSLPSVGILLPRVESVATGFKFPDHEDFSVGRSTAAQIFPSRLSVLKGTKSAPAEPLRDRVDERLELVIANKLWPQRLSGHGTYED
jgi:hypothetical protein